MLGKSFSRRSGRAPGQASQGRGHSTEPDRVQEVFGQHSQTHGLICGWSCVDSGVGLLDPCEFLLIQNSL